MSDNEKCPLQKMSMDEVPESVRAELVRAFGGVRWKAFRCTDAETGALHGFSFNSGDAVVSWSDGKWSVANPVMCDGREVHYADTLEAACVQCVSAMARETKPWPEVNR